ncbi:MAG: TAT-variant-translocated molybdopterin oxidoreductase [Rhodopila sp.]|nr:TAT-variant-translocated molybdopterin oxidoreductase [Rhodopila sp.]
MPSMNGQWRGLDRLSRDPAFVARASAEFPQLAAALAAPRNRRGVLKLMAAGLALAGLGGCDDGAPGGVLIPPVLPPTDTVSAGSHLFATASVGGGYANGILVRHVNGRPIKVEGNPAHPASLGGTSAIGQAEVLGFYDPDRSRGLTRDGEPQAWSSLLTALAAQRQAMGQSHGEGFRILTGSTTSPTLARQIIALKQLYPGVRWHRWEPVSRDAVRAGAILAYGQPVELVPKLDAVDLLLTIDSDLFDGAPGHLRFARDFAARRNPTRTDRMNRAYAIEPTPTLMGVAADHRFIAGPRDLARIIPALAAWLLGGEPSADMPAWFAPLVGDMKATRGRCFVHAGPDQPAGVHALVHAMNEALGGRGQTYDLIAPVEADPVNHGASLRSLIDDMTAGRVTTLVIIDSNPVFTAPGFGDALTRVAVSMTLADGSSETAAKTQWSLPARHGFEDWSDALAYDGTVTLLQPQARPLYDGISPHSLLALFAAPEEVYSRDVVRQTHGLNDQQWHDALAAGLVAGTQAAPTDVALKPIQAPVGGAMAAPAQQDITLLVRPDPHIWDGRYANNAWLQELPRPLTKLTWDNPLLVSPAIAERLKLLNGDRVTVANGATEVTLAAWIMPGQAPECVVALLGFGRTDVGMVGQGVGYDVYPLTAGSGPVLLHKAGGRDVLASTERHDPIFADAGEYVHHGTLAAFKADPAFLGKPASQPQEYNRRPTGPAAWGMSIDLNACIGCNACVVACMAENNIPVVGKQQVIHEREMHWLRIDRYYEGSPEAPDMFFQPVMCQHCERAPCEIVCPVGATVHDEEGLNVMVYNRCVGTRFCSNNCPYKVRRFNYYAFAAEERRPAVARNPEVTVRARGVMEKCTFCLQRIAAARIDADSDNRPVGANEVQTACQAACPTQAFTFGNMAEGGQVVERKKSPLTYALLGDQDTRPRVTYEGRIRNASSGAGA